jgi:rare lipoprotein A
MNRSLRGICAVIALGALAAGCASEPSPPENQSVAVPPNAGVYKIGNPYQIGDTWYYPREQPDYDETGIASWYGPTFYGHATSDGEMFDANALTAAHRTLPMPVNVRVTNLENGRSLVVRVNDRGPFAKGRIIDVSEKAAKLLGFFDQGTARVRVQFVARADLPNGEPQPFGVGTPAELQNAVTAAPSAPVQEQALAPIGAASAAPAPPSEQPPPEATPPAPLPPNTNPQTGGLPTGNVIEVPVPVVTHLYVQVGAFSSYANASRLAARLGAGLRISPFQHAGQTLYRVRLGPFDQTADADAALARVSGQGANDAQIVVDQ